jgi:hypothetical protein
LRYSELEESLKKADGEAQEKDITLQLLHEELKALQGQVPQEARGQD